MGRSWRRGVVELWYVKLALVCGGSDSGMFDAPQTKYRRHGNDTENSANSGTPKFTGEG